MFGKGSLEGSEGYDRVEIQQLSYKLSEKIGEEARFRE